MLMNLVSPLNVVTHPVNTRMTGMEGETRFLSWSIPPRNTHHRVMLSSQPERIKMNVNYLLASFLKTPSFSASATKRISATSSYLIWRIFESFSPMPARSDAIPALLT